MPKDVPFANYVEAIAYVEVGDINSVVGSPPWPSDAGAPTGCVDPIVDAGTDAPVATGDAEPPSGDGGPKVITTTTTTSRQIQFGLKLVF